MESTAKRSVTRYRAGKVDDRNDLLVQEISCSIFIEDSLIINTVCGPENLESLVFGYLFINGYIFSAVDVLEITNTGFAYNVRIKNSRKTPKETPVTSNYILSPSSLLLLTEEALNKAVLFPKTGGTHSASLVMENGDTLMCEDISRSAALEKAVGRAVLKGVPLGRSILILSSRIPEGFIRKIATAGIPVVAAVSAPTAQAVDLARELGICLCGFVRGDSMNIYTNSWRLGLKSEDALDRGSVTDGTVR